MRLSACFSILGCATPALAQCPQWSADFHPNAVAGSVFASVVFDDGNGPALYVAGRIDVAGELSVNNIARWDGSSWSALGSGVDNDVEALAVYDDGTGAKLYATGDFLNAGGAPATRIACWDGSSWGALGSGLSATGMTLCAHDDGSGPALFVGGNFTTAGGVSSSRVARWNGSWSAVGAPAAGHAVRALATFDVGGGTRLYAGGQSTLAEWNGSSWTNLVPGGFTGVARALIVHDDGAGAALYAVGNFSLLAGVQAFGVARWSGGAWQALGPGIVVTNASSLGSYTDTNGPALYIGGGTGLDRWTAQNGLVDAGLAGSVASMTVFDDGSGAKLFAAGAISYVGGQHAWNVARFDGTQWSEIGDDGSAPGGYLTAFEVADLGSGPTLYAGGTLDNGRGGVIAWNGADWDELGGSIEGRVFELAVHDDGSGTKLYAGGAYMTGQSQRVAILAWDGAQWSTVGSGLYNLEFLSGGVFELASFDDGSGPKLYAAGEFASVLYGAMQRLARWDGAQWTILPNQPDDDIAMLRTLDDGSGPALYACGAFTGIGGVVAPYLARFYGTTWAPFGSTPPRPVYAVELHDDGSGLALYASSAKPQPPPTTLEYTVIKWDGAAWVELAAWPRFIAQDLQSYDDGSGPSLFAAGHVYQPADQRCVKELRNGAWIDHDVRRQQVGSLSTDANDLIVFDDAAAPHGALWVCGDFWRADGEPSRSVARYSDPCACSGTSYCTSGTTSSGCAPSISGTGTASASASSGFTIELTQLEGAKLGHVFYGINGPHAAPWGASSHFLCVKAPTQRTPTQSTGGTDGACDGAFALDWNAYVATHPGALGVPFSAGAQVWAQAYFRDPPGPKTTALSNALTFTVCP